MLRIFSPKLGRVKTSNFRCGDLKGGMRIVCELNTSVMTTKIPGFNQFISESPDGNVNRSALLWLLYVANLISLIFIG